MSQEPKQRQAQTWYPPHHPGWADRLSPSLRPYKHATPPEVNAWATSEHIHARLITEKGMAPLHRAIRIHEAQKRLDYDLDFTYFQYPRGAKGWKAGLSKKKSSRGKLRRPSPLSQCETVQDGDAETGQLVVAFGRMALERPMRVV
ncbi:uncharacterized protein J3D65DRAFT_666869 [Phyllosticta citribraziliensis]|uniref:Uncharacterized protein n=1 Tax=Phyllosticta citribraziliensis TaxID=989973 RepID=A0ABR1LSL3_9PEZI